jgi:hypothetical protein
MAAIGAIVLAACFNTAFAADAPLVGAWQLDPAQSGQTALYLFTPTRYSMVLAATDRPDIVDTSKATAGSERARRYGRGSADLEVRSGGVKWGKAAGKGTDRTASDSLRRKPCRRSQTQCNRD